jgi:rare lipoprotein A
MKRPSPSLAVSLAALVVALGGTGYAVTQLPKNSVGTAQIKVEYMGKAGLQGSDDNRLLASLRTDGRPATLDGSPSLPPTMVAQNPPPQERPAPQRMVAAEESRVLLAPVAPAPPVVEMTRIAATPANVPLPPSRPFDLGVASIGPR